MRVGVYFCRCGGTISDRVDGERLGRECASSEGVAYSMTDVKWYTEYDKLAGLYVWLYTLDPEDYIVIQACHNDLLPCFPVARYRPADMQRQAGHIGSKNNLL